MHGFACEGWVISPLEVLGTAQKPNEKACKVRFMKIGLAASDLGAPVPTITARRRLTVVDERVTEPPPRVSAKSGGARARLLESIHAWDLLQILLTQERWRCQHRLKIFDAKAALAQALSDFTAAYAKGMGENLGAKASDLSHVEPVRKSSTVMPDVRHLPGRDATHENESLPAVVSSTCLTEECV